jgi:hypothetical protein
VPNSFLCRNFSPRVNNLFSFGSGFGFGFGFCFGVGNLANGVGFSGTTGLSCPNKLPVMSGALNRLAITSNPFSSWRIA